MPQDKNSYIIQTIKAYSKSLLMFIRKRVKNDADAEDILHDVWYQFSTLVNAAPIEQTSAWLYRVARNRILDKHKKHTETLLDDILINDGDTGDGPDFSGILMPEVTTPETVYLRNLFWEQLFLALDELPEAQKQVFIWHEIEDISFDEMASRTGENTNTLVSRKRYAVLHLRKRLKQLYKEVITY